MPSDPRRTTLWTHRTRAGRTVECVTWLDPEGIQVVIIYDGSTLVHQTFVRPDDAEMWSAQQLELHRLSLQKRAYCPRCDAVTDRLPRSPYERILELFTRKRPHRCSRCRWRGWQVPA
jgi:hypothetical protein